MGKSALEYTNHIYGITEKSPALEQDHLKNHIIPAGTGIALNNAGSAPAGRVNESEGSGAGPLSKLSNSVAHPTGGVPTYDQAAWVFLRSGTVTRGSSVQ